MWQWSLTRDLWSFSSCVLIKHHGMGNLLKVCIVILMEIVSVMKLILKRNVTSLKQNACTVRMSCERGRNPAAGPADFQIWWNDRAIISHFYCV